MPPLSRTSFLLALLVSLTLVQAATLKGTIYSDQLQPVTNALIEINSFPTQRYLARDGTYIFEIPPGKYVLTTQKEAIISTEELEITVDGVYVYDLFLLPDFTDEEDLWNDTEQQLFEEEPGLKWWQYLGIFLVIGFALYRIIRARQKYGSLRLFRKRMNVEQHKTIEQHQQELAQEPGYVEKALEIITQHDGRISQKELRKEMLYLSEAKVSLIVTELEHKGRIEKIKKGRGNVIILK